MHLFAYAWRRPQARAKVAGVFGAVMAAGLSVGVALAQPAPPSPPGGGVPPAQGPERQPPTPPPGPQYPAGRTVNTDGAKQSVVDLSVYSSMSLVHVGSSDSFAITEEGRTAARLLLEAIEEKAPAKAIEAGRIYEQIIPRENYGGEYTALHWFADYFVAPEAERAKFLEDPQTKLFFEMYGGNDYAVLQEYLKRKYHLRDIGDEETKAGQDRKIYLEDTILFNNPRREDWEKTSELMKLLKLKPGQVIADVGSGPGYFTFKFSRMVGPQGRVFAIDMVADHLKYVEKAKIAFGAQNVQTIQTDGRTIGLADQKVDAVYLCSLYHNIYAMSTAPERDAFVDSIRAALKDDGTLYLVDNGLVEPGVLPYHGPYVAKELLIGQMRHYGFELVEQHQHIPQRYLLVFKKLPEPQPQQPPRR